MEDIGFLKAVYPNKVSESIFQENQEFFNIFKKTTALDRLYHKPRALKVAKVQDIRNLLQFIPPIYHAFYNAIKSDGPLKGHVNDVFVHPELDCSDEKYIPDYNKHLHCNDML